MNSIFYIEAYKRGPIWMFDDPDKGLYREAFVAGADAVIELASGGYNTVGLTFSRKPFPGYQRMFERIGFVHGGASYLDTETGKEAWLCPAMKKYFLWHPRKLYISFAPFHDPIENPTWNDLLLTDPFMAASQEEFDAMWQAERQSMARMDPEDYELKGDGFYGRKVEDPMHDPDTAEGGHDYMKEWDR